MTMAFADAGLALLPVLPWAGTLAIALGGRRLSERAAAATAVGAAGLAALLALALAGEAASGVERRVVLGSWMAAPDFTVRLAFRLDALSATAAAVVASVGFLIHLYSVGYMAGEEGYRRFFSLMNFFVGAMLVLVLADDLALLYLGWEGVGLASYLLIGFWFAEPANVRAARKAFVMTRLGDAALAVGLLHLATSLGTLEVSAVARAPAAWVPDTGPAVLAAALLVTGAAAKSAQVPLQTWLPDAMAGPTPVSALLHAATMVAAGVYLLARTSGILAAAPSVQAVVAAIGTATFLLGGGSALAQRDLKRALAYSTMSQIGLMFAALGAGAAAAAIFHFAAHAFFKALLFLSGGAIILAARHEQNVFRLGGLARRMPGMGIAFAIGAVGLAGLPFATVGFWSKEAVLSGVWASSRGGPWLACVLLAGSALTALYAFRLAFLVFFGPERRVPAERPPAILGPPIAALTILTVGAGLLEGPALAFLGRALPSPSGPEVPVLFEAAALWVPLLGASVALALWGVRPAWREALVRSRAAEAIRKGALQGWGFDAAYGALVGRPVERLARAAREDVADEIPRALERAAKRAHRGLAGTQTGRLRTYAGAIAIGAILLVAILVVAA
jgi:NADH-quinone oxidoreductase subunit L